MDVRVIALSLFTLGSVAGQGFHETFWSSWVALVVLAIFLSCCTSLCFFVLIWMICKEGMKTGKDLMKTWKMSNVEEGEVYFTPEETNRNARVGNEELVDQIAGKDSDVEGGLHDVLVEVPDSSVEDM